ncbi:T9SS type B sorting domain-containing protein [Flavobacterium sp. Sd200]|uniref:T9SS type B sorting domain-containing protein n=1 Tax=Flavobacterium sp. Sd200 TaxID=2692211 RepID=UPI00136E4BFE|nr:T9SS type B sorting domain-containing protein [Flavobacterium sp. Sd200]MXN92962.1 T9SS type B sorting domain-containing protein [Flavobacterium sp. Sd200]
MRKIKNAALLFLLLFAVNLNAQLSDFNFTVEKTDETCLGNGSMTFTVANTTANSSILYQIYKLPNTSQAISVTQESYIGGLNSGNYKVVALQTLGSMQNSKEQTVSIADRKVPFNFVVSSSNLNCAAGGTMVVRATSGVIASCEIISGPVTMPLQSSNVFNDMPAGNYNVRAYSECGASRVKSFTLSLVNSVLEISDTFYPDTIAQCDSITVSNTITSSSGTINYPITVRHTLSSMDIGGNSIVMEKVFETGNPTAQEVSVVMPRYMNTEYTYDMEVIDYCRTYPKEGIPVDQNISLSLSPGNALCGEKYLRLSVAKFTGSYRVEFISVPQTTPAFSVLTYNDTPLGPFTEGTVQYGDEDLSLPFGNYTIRVTDDCGRTATEDVLLEFTPLRPSVTKANNGCFSHFGYINISIPRQKILTAVITQAPADYTGPLEVTSKINNNGVLNLRDLPLGWYTIELTDDCGFDYTERVEVPEYRDKLYNITALPSCSPGFGTVRFRSNNGDLDGKGLVEAKITEAPAEFMRDHALPYDVTSLINNANELYIDNLPEGSYKFWGNDVCGVISELPINVEGYILPVNPVTVTPKCGGFSIKLEDRSNGLEGASYWLQKFNTTTGKWGHLSNTNSYVEGQVPTASNAVQISNNATRNNLNYSGHFRVVKKFECFGNGTSTNTQCVSVLSEFDYTEQFAINTVYSLACLNRPNDVMVEVTGYPTAYRITKKDGRSFIVNNGTNNVFTNLGPGEYVFEIQDDCGNIEPKTVFIQTLPTSSDPIKPKDMVLCANKGETVNNVYHLTDQNPQILGPLHSAMYDITFHLTQEDADAGTNALPEFYTSTHDGQTIYVRMQNNVIELCGGTTSFKLFKGFNLEPVITKEGVLCNDGMIKLTADAGYDKYQWSTGETTRSIFVNEGGDYTVSVFKKYGDNFGCPGETSVSIEQSFTPVVTKVLTEDWTTDQNMITVITQGADSYEYSLDGVKYQTSNVFTGLEAGKYTVHVKDSKGCGKVTYEVVLLNYPKFFTPNGDGSNETWQIKNSATEPHMHVTIFDRYGKLITTFGSNEKGWDGTLNGIQLPSTDYWFVVTREDGRELKGHFSMMR